MVLHNLSFKQHSYNFSEKILFEVNGSNLQLLDNFINKEGESSPSTNFNVTVLCTYNTFRMSPISTFHIKLHADVSEIKYSYWVRKLLY